MAAKKGAKKDVDLVHEVEALKAKLCEPSSDHELLLEIESLKDSIMELNGIFTKALHEMKGEDNLQKSIANLTEKIEAVITQNETIARGMIAVSDKVTEFVSRPAPHHVITPPPIQNPRMPARPPMPAPPKKRESMF